MTDGLGPKIATHTVPWSSRVAYVILAIASAACAGAGMVAMVGSLSNTDAMGLAWALVAAGVGVALVVVGAMSGVSAVWSAIDACALRIDRHENGLRFRGRQGERIALWSDVEGFARGLRGVVLGFRDRMGSTHAIHGALAGRGDLLVALARAVHEETLELANRVREGDPISFPIDTQRRIEIDARGVRWNESLHANLVMHPRGDVAWTRIGHVALASAWTVCLTLDDAETNVVTLDFESEDGMRCAVLVDELRRMAIAPTPYRGAT
jgi:hypothetical protein